MFLDIGAERYEDRTRAPLPTIPRGFGDRFDLELEAFRSADQFFSRENILYQAYEDAGEAMFKASGRRVGNPLAADPVMRDYTMEAFRTALTEARANDPSLPDPDRLEADAIAAAGERVKAARLAGQVPTAGGEAGAFLGALTGGITDPAVLLTLPFGASARLSGGVASRILKTAMIEGAIGGGIQAVIEGKTLPLKAEMGVEAQPLANIATTALGAALLGGGGRGLVEAWRAFRGGRAVSRVESDAAAVLDRQAADIDASPGPDVRGHLDALDAATAAVARGEPFVPQGPFSLLRAVGRDLSAEDVLRLGARSSELTERLKSLPAMAPERADTLARVEAIEARLADPAIMPPERRALAARRDELLADVDPGTLRAEAATAIERRNAENELASTRDRLRDIEVNRFTLKNEMAARLPKATAEGLTLAKGSLAGIERGVKAGVIPARMSPTAPMGRALDAVATAAREKIDVADVIIRDPMAYSDTDRAFLALMRDDGGKPLPAARLAERLKGYADEAAKVGDGAPASALDPAATRRAAMVTETKIAAERMDAPEIDEARLQEARRIAADADPDIEGRKASDLLDEAAERKRVAKEIADACAFGRAAE